MSNFEKGISEPEESLLQLKQLFNHNVDSLNLALMNWETQQTSGALSRINNAMEGCLPVALSVQCTKGHLIESFCV